jgi:hypothetical protein
VIHDYLESYTDVWMQVTAYNTTPEIHLTTILENWGLLGYNHVSLSLSYFGDITSDSNPNLARFEEYGTQLEFPR